MKVGIDIHGVLDHHPEKFIKLANSIRDQFGIVYIITGPTEEKAESELREIAVKHNFGIRFWDEVYSIVDTIIEKDIPYTVKDNGHVWTDKKEDWDCIKGELAHKLGLDIHFDDSPEYEEYFPPGVFCYVKRREA